jgi:hypothetical protein
MPILMNELLFSGGKVAKLQMFVILLSGSKHAIKKTFAR